MTERSGGVAAILCDTKGNTVRQGYCYTCLAIGGYSIGSLRTKNSLIYIENRNCLKHVLSNLVPSWLMPNSSLLNPGCQVIRNPNRKRFARIDSQKKKKNFITCERFARIASDLQISIHKKGVQFGNPDKIRENEAIRANLRLDFARICDSIRANRVI